MLVGRQLEHLLTSCPPSLVPLAGGIQPFAALLRRRSEGLLSFKALQLDVVVAVSISQTQGNLLGSWQQGKRGVNVATLVAMPDDGLSTRKNLALVVVLLALDAQIGSRLLWAMPT